MKEFWLLQVIQAIWSSIQLYECGFATGSVNPENILYHCDHTPRSIIHVPGLVKFGQQSRNN